MVPGRYRCFLDYFSNHNEVQPAAPKFGFGNIPTPIMPRVYQAGPQTTGADQGRNLTDGLQFCGHSSFKKHSRISFWVLLFMASNRG